MELDDLKSSWKKSGGDLKKESELEIMTKISGHPTLKRIRIKLMIESAFLAFLLLNYYTVLDGDKKPLWVNVLFVTSVVLFILNDVLGYYFVMNSIKADTIRLSLQKQVRLLKRLSIFSMVSASIYAFTLLFFLTYSTEPAHRSYGWVIGVIVTFLVMLYFSFKDWRNKIHSFERLLEEFGEG